MSLPLKLVSIDFAQAFSEPGRVYVNGNFSVFMPAFQKHGYDWLKKTLETIVVAHAYKRYPTVEKLTVDVTTFHFQPGPPSGPDYQIHEFMVDVLLDPPLDKIPETETIKSSVEKALLLEKPDAEWNF